jgi:cytochrome P450
MPRIDPKNTIIYNNYILPPGTSISMSIPSVHFNENIYPNPLSFDPERFLRPAEKERSEAYVVPFGGGSRICVGKEFALMTLYLATAMLFSRFEMELYESTERDVSMAHEMFAPFPPADSRGVWVKLK